MCDEIDKLLKYNSSSPSGVLNFLMLKFKLPLFNTNKCEGRIFGLKNINSHTKQSVW